MRINKPSTRSDRADALFARFSIQRCGTRGQVGECGMRAGSLRVLVKVCNRHGMFTSYLRPILALTQIPCTVM